MNRTQPVRVALVIVIVGTAVVLSRLERTPTTPEPSSTAAPSTPAGAPAGPDSVRLLRDLSVLAHDSMQGRGTGTPGGERARTFLMRELEAAGIAPIGDAFEHRFSWGEDRVGVNLLGQIVGRSTAPVIVLSAHYDHVGVRDGVIFNGADDNASGAAALLEIGRILAGEPLDHTLVLALFDAEESGLQGARTFVDQPPVPTEIALNVNLDMVSRTDGELWAAGASHTPALRAVLQGVADTAPLRLRLGHDRPDDPEGDDWTSASDHGPFHAAGIPFVYFGVEDHPDYHQPTDDFAAVDPGEFLASVRTILAALRALDAALPLSNAENAA